MPPVKSAFSPEEHFGHLSSAVFLILLGTYIITLPLSRNWSTIFPRLVCRWNPYT
ncbi:uncharacterized protein BDR25DRAFT_301070 [Lindgomyces ingoldianus]|uniref:Uncharacterized protein n=1 Tax=Lindgomyces ingoldianus TaxID=673940 RepID=A0ACB6R7Y1_9PLEO|nr:uncharacterized protein BDR25DRAFT_301070 [Lindgomyces ingoldianus]KAF2475359.1 hypothetical protein BDR25DRAFT_301070 [Lindgomyces ingoldianus]